MKRARDSKASSNEGSMNIKATWPNLVPCLYANAIATD